MLQGVINGTRIKQAQNKFNRKSKGWEGEKTTINQHVVAYNVDVPRINSLSLN